MVRQKEKRWKAVCLELAALLKETREHKGLSKAAVAERTGLSDVMIGYVESAARTPTIQTLLRMADALEVELAELIHEAERRAR